MSAIIYGRIRTQAVSKEVVKAGLESLSDRTHVVERSGQLLLYKKGQTTGRPLLTMAQAKDGWSSKWDNMYEQALRMMWGVDSNTPIDQTVQQSVAAAVVEREASKNNWKISRSWQQTQEGGQKLHVRLERTHW